MAQGRVAEWLEPKAVLAKQHRRQLERRWKSLVPNKIESPTKHPVNELIY